MSDTKDSLSNYDARDIIEKDKKHLWHHMVQHKIFESQDPKVFVEGEGVRLKDIDGNEYLDGASGGVWCVNVGYGRESIARVITPPTQGNRAPRPLRSSKVSASNPRRER